MLGINHIVRLRGIMYKKEINNSNKIPKQLGILKRFYTWRYEHQNTIIFQNTSGFITTLVSRQGRKR